MAKDFMAAGAKRMKLTGAKERHVELMRYYSQLTLEKLSEPKHATWIPRMDRPGRSVHMGRALTKRLIDFISKERGIGLPAPRELVIAESATASFDFFQSDDEYGFSFITGTPGAGKTWSLRASVLYLYGKFAEERAKEGTSRMKRILFLEGEDFEISPMAVLRRALFQSYSDDEAALRELDSMQQTLTPDALEDFIIASKEHLIVVIDDANKVKRRGNAHNLLSLLRKYCPVIFCGSVSPEWIDVMRHPKASDYELVVGGLNDEELACFLKRFAITRIDLHETGTVPRLIQLYWTKTAVFEDTMKQLEDGIDQFLVKALQHPDLRGQLAGSLQVDRLSPILESRCFYRGEDGFLECLTPRLLGHATARITEMLDLQDLDSKRKELAVWMQPILSNELRCRIGLNAEMAAILAMKFFTGNVFYETDKCVQLDVRRVRSFEGQMSRSVLEAEPDETEGGTLFVPRSGGRHAGIDVYYRDGKFLIAVQISVQRNAEDHHQKTVEKAEEVFDGEKREKLLLWVIDTDDWCSYHTSSRSYYYVTMPFRCLSSQLATVDDRLRALRRTSNKKDVCWECHTEAGDSDCVQCDFCDLWYHKRCVAADMKARTSLRRTTAKTLHSEFILASDQPFECRGCRDHCPRKGRT